MPKINNTAVIQKLVDELKLYPAADQIPTQLAEKIIPTYQINSDVVAEVSPRPADIVRTEFRSTAGSVTLYTTPATGKFYMTNVVLTLSGNPNGSGVDHEATVNITINGTTQPIAKCLMDEDSAAAETENQVIVLNLQNPVIVDSATNIVLTLNDNGDYANATIIGYNLD